MKSKVYKKIIEDSKNSSANPHIGAIIKRRRHSLNMTLEETTRGICCVSYLSKLEHGTITPKKYVLNEVLERLNMKEEILRSKTEYLKLINNCLIELYHDNPKYVCDTFNTITDLECIHFTDVLKGIYYAVMKKYDEAEKYINNALIIKKELEQDELYACIIISAYIQVGRKKYSEALEILKTIEHIYLGNIEIEKLKMSIISNVYLVLGKYLQLSKSLIMYQDLCSKTVDFKGMMEAKKKFCISLALCGDEEGALEQYEFISRSLSDDESKDLLKAIYYSLKKPNELLKISNITIIEKLWAYNMLNQKAKCIEIVNRIKPIEIEDGKERMFVESMMKKYLENEYFYILYLRDIYYPYLLEHGFYEDAKETRKILFDYLIVETRYKEAIRIEKDFKKIF